MSEISEIKILDSGLKVSISAGKRVYLSPKKAGFEFNNPMTVKEKPDNKDNTEVLAPVTKTIVLTDPTTESDESKTRRRTPILWYFCCVIVGVIILAAALRSTLRTSQESTVPTILNSKMLTLTVNTTCTTTGSCTEYNYTTITDLRCSIMNLTGTVNNANVKIIIDSWIEANGTVVTVNPNDPLNLGTCTENGRLNPSGILGSIPNQPVSVNITMRSTDSSVSLTEKVDQFYGSEMRIDKCFIEKVYVAPSPSVTPTATPSSSQTGTPTPSSSQTGTPTPSSTGTDSPTSSPSFSSTSTSTMTGTGTNTPSQTPTPTGTDTPSPSTSFSSTNTGTSTTTATGTDTPSASQTPSNSPTASITPSQTSSSSPVVQYGNWKTTTFSFWFTPTLHLMNTNTLDSFNNFAHAVPFTVTSTTTISRLAFLFYFRGTVGAAYTFNLAILAAASQANFYVPTGSILTSKTGLSAPASTAQTINTFVTLEIPGSALGSMGTYSLSPGVYNLVIYGASSLDVTLSHHNTSFASVVTYGGNFAKALSTDNKCLYPYLSGTSATGSWGPACQTWCGKGIVNDCANVYIE